MCSEDYPSKTQITLCHAMYYEYRSLTAVITKWEEYKMWEISEKPEICEWKYVLVFHKIAIL